MGKPVFTGRLTINPRAEPPAEPEAPIDLEVSSQAGNGLETAEENTGNGTPVVQFFDLDL